MQDIDLNEIRSQIDDIDNEIIDLYKKRIDIAAKVAEYKAKTGKAILDAKREEEKLATLSGLSDDEFDKIAIVELYKQIMTVSRRYQYKFLGDKGKLKKQDFRRVDFLPKINEDKAKVVYQGAIGAYSHQATLNYFGKNIDCYAVEKFEDAINEVETGNADYAMLPIENSTAGSVVDVYDILFKHNVYIVADYMQEINHALLGIKGSKMSDIKNVYSHIQALMQCEDFLDENNLIRYNFANTALAAKKIKEDGDIHSAAIASEGVAGIYDLEILAKNISKSSDNITRFIVLTKDRIYKSVSANLSFVFELPHKSGSLYNILGNFIFNGINMKKIESRPIKNKKWEYRFFVDIEGSLGEAGTENALAAIEAETGNIKILGTY